VLAQVVGAQTQLLATLLATIAELDQAIGNRLGNHPKVGLLARLPRVGQLSHAQLLAELGPILDRASSAEHAAAQAGAAPVTRASGKTSSVHFRLAATIEPAKPCTSSPTTPATVPMGSHPVCRRPRPRQMPPPSSPGPRRAWLRVIWACWHTNTAYDPAKHRAEQHLPA
jgi:hypothetical protein